MTDLLVVAQSKVWNQGLIANLKHATGFEVVEVRDSSQLTNAFLKNLEPKFVFFPHWSTLIHEDVYENFECIIFHMTDLPYGRGGSPLQNLIMRGIKNTKVSAIRCVNDLDAGPIYLKKPLNLDGTAQEIYFRTANIIEEMIIEIVKGRPKPIDQNGEVTVFKRRRPCESEINNFQSLNDLYNFIRMLDADGYPHAFVEFGEFKIEFRNAKLLDGRLNADACFIRNEVESEPI